MDFKKNKTTIFISLFFIILIIVPIVLFTYKKYSANKEFVANFKIGGISDHDSDESLVLDDDGDDDIDDDNNDNDIVSSVSDKSLSIEEVNYSNNHHNDETDHSNGDEESCDRKMSNDILNIQNKMSSLLIPKDTMLHINVKKRRNYTINTFPIYFTLSSSSITILNIMQNTYFNNIIIKFYKEKLCNYDDISSISPVYEINVNGSDSLGNKGGIKVNDELIKYLPSTSSHGIPIKSLKIYTPLKKSKSHKKKNICSLIINYNDIKEVIHLDDMREFNTIFIHKKDLESPVYLKLSK
ncbi:MAG: hypothetical protein [Cotesia congregata filamentous virus 2]